MRPNATLFPFSRDTAIPQSLEYLGGLLDRGWTVGIFPEGEQRVGLRREAVPVRIGAPVVFQPNTSYTEATEQLEEAVRSL